MKELKTPDTLREFADAKVQQELHNNYSRHAWEVVLNRMCTELGPLADLRPRDIPREAFMRVRRQLSESALTPTPERPCIVRLRHFLADLVPYGLAQGCVDVFKNYRFGLPAPHQFGRQNRRRRHAS